MALLLKVMKTPLDNSVGEKNVLFIFGVLGEIVVSVSLSASVCVCAHGCVVSRYIISCLHLG